MTNDERARIEAACVAICQTGKFETGEGTCAIICMDQFGPVRSRPCSHAKDVHQKTAIAVLQAADALRTKRENKAPWPEEAIAELEAWENKWNDKCPEHYFETVSSQHHEIWVLRCEKLEVENERLRTKPESEWNEAIEAAASGIEVGLTSDRLGRTAKRRIQAEAAAIRSLKRDP